MATRVAKSLIRRHFNRTSSSIFIALQLNARL